MTGQVANRVRGLKFLSDVLSKRREDPFCPRCKAFANTAGFAREEYASFIQSGEALPSDFESLLSEAGSAFDLLQPGEGLTGQKRAGNCKLPEGVCFVKSAKALYQKLSGEGETA